MNIELSTEQEAAIGKMKQLHGQYWKDELKKSWRTGVYTWGLDSGEVAELQRLRNKIGNSGIDKIYHD
ncbi:hypothetical protein [Thiolapillus sp.]|uniref:hypothetical protein n=1 Tax=Thiolapillus sp. TaxID=2017437 RepID=UPI003AF6ACA5